MEYPLHHHGGVTVTKMNKVWISRSYLSAIISEIEDYAPLETGGAFFGYIAENKDIVITDLIHAGPKAKRSRYSFLPDQEFQINEMAHLFEQSHCKTTYLGDWHSHPTTSPALSWKDERTLLKIALSDEAQCKKPLMMVIGSLPEKWNINCVQFQSGKKKIWPFFSCEYRCLRIEVD